MTTWTTPRTWATSDVITATLLNTHLRDNLNDLHTSHGFRVYQAAALSQTSSGNYQLTTWDTTDDDPDSVFSLSTDLFTVPSGRAGVWRFLYLANWSGNTTGVRHLRIAKNETYTTRTPNGVGVTIADVIVSNLGGSAIGQILGVKARLAVGDTVSFQAHQSSGGSLAFNVGTEQLFVEGEYLGA